MLDQVIVGGNQMHVVLQGHESSGGTLNARERDNLFTYVDDSTHCCPRHYGMFEPKCRGGSAIATACPGTVA
ncbi:hypothetical protein, partial [Rhodococcus sp. (in: high G+C Gram-positive bacteria)]|uniref:hypothetical protein n=1 Tax=Rhodococcus sp. TaxID=1831 RepID=UPI00257F2D9B